MITSTADKVLDVLLLFKESRPELTVDEVSDLIGAPRSTTYRYVRTLRDKGFLEKTPAGVLRLGPRLVELGRVARSKSDISDVALPVMEEIAQQTRETVLLTRLAGHSAVCLERIEGPQTIRITFELGQIRPLHAGASSKILLAFVDEDVWDEYISPPLERFTENTVTDPDTLKQQLRDIRRQGYCMSDSEVDAGARAVAVPILDERDRLIAGLSTAGPAFRMDSATIERHVEILRAGIATIRTQFTRNTV